MKTCVFLALTLSGLLSGTAAEKSSDGSGEDAIRKADLVSLSYQQAVKDFGEGIQDFHAEITYGDLSGDGEAEAAVTVHCRFGPFASANPSDVFVYAIRAGRPEFIAHAGNGEKAHGGICLAYICCDGCELTCGTDLKGNGHRRLVVHRFRPDHKDCNACYGSIEETEYELRGSNLVLVNSKTTPIGNLDPSDPCAIHTPK